MKRLLSILILLLVLLPARAADVQWLTDDFTGSPLTNRLTYITPIASYGVSGSRFVTGDRRVYTNDSTGSLIVSNLAVGRSYRVEFVGPYTTTVITNSFDTNVVGFVNAADPAYLAAPIRDSAILAYSQAAADAKFHKKTGDTSTNVNFRGTIKIPAGATVGYVLTATNSDGSAAWQAATGSSGSLDTNTVTSISQQQMRAATNVVNAAQVTATNYIGGGGGLTNVTAESLTPNAPLSVNFLGGTLTSGNAQMGAGGFSVGGGGSLTPSGFNGHGAGLTNNNGLGFATRADFNAATTITPWATGGSGSTSSVPVVVWQTVIQRSNQMHNAFPTVDVDPTTGEIWFTWSQGTNHSQLGMGVGMLAKSVDGGRTVQPAVTNLNLGTTGIGPGTNWGISHYMITTMRDGTKLEWSNIRTNGSNGGATNLLRESRDGGLTWTTNSYPHSPLLGNFQICNSGVHETPGGAWLAHIFEDDGTRRVATLRSTNRGAYWVSTMLSDGTDGSVQPAETCFANLGSEVYANVRNESANRAFSTYRSLDDGITWLGPYTNSVAVAGTIAQANPHTEFLGKRMYVTQRGYDLYWPELLWFDDYPYYTNLTGRMILMNRPSLYTAIKKLSENVLVAAAACANEPFSSTFASTNADVTAFIIAQNGVGWNMHAEPSERPTPFYSLRNRDLPYNASGFIWPQGGSLAHNATNVNTPVVTTSNRVKRVSIGNAGLGGFQIGATLADTIPLHNTNQLTIIWKGQITNTAQYASLITCSLGTAHSGLRVWFYGNRAWQVWQGRGTSGTWAGNYLGSAPRSLPSDPLYTMTPGVFALRLTNETAQLFFNGARMQFHSYNLTTPTYYTNVVVDNAALGVGMIGGASVASANNGMLLEGIEIYTNALSDAQIAEAGAEMYRDSLDAEDGSASLNVIVTGSGATVLSNAPSIRSLSTTGSAANLSTGFTTAAESVFTGNGTLYIAGRRLRFPDFSMQLYSPFPAEFHAGIVTTNSIALRQNPAWPTNNFIGSATATNWVLVTWRGWVVTAATNHQVGGWMWQTNGPNGYPVAGAFDPATMP